MDRIEVKGTIFDIRRAALDDGGTRTTVFLKGCPLHCIWCSEPAGLKFRRRPVYDKKACIHCSSCVRAARHGGVKLGPGKAIRLDVFAPENWGYVIDECPSGALHWDSRCVTPEGLAGELLKDGVTREVVLSGGEPLMQPEFAAAFLRLMKEKGIRTALATSLYVPVHAIMQVQPYLDVLYVDLKIFDSGWHRKYTGVYNGRIKQNLRYLLESSVREKIVISTPLIPDFTTRDENLAAIARFVADIYPKVRYELRNYDTKTAGRYESLGREYCFAQDIIPYSPEQLAGFTALVRKNGLREAGIGTR